MDGPVIAALVGLVTALALFGLGKGLEKRATNKAVLAEIDRLLDVARRHETWWRDCMERGDTDVVLIPFSTDIYDRQIDRIGALDNHYVADVVKFYGYIKFLNTFQLTRKAGGADAAFSAAYLKSLRRLVTEYGTAFEPAFASYGIH